MRSGFQDTVPCFLRLRVSASRKPVSPMDRKDLLVGFRGLRCFCGTRCLPRPPNTRQDIKLPLLGGSSEQDARVHDCEPECAGELAHTRAPSTNRTSEAGMVAIRSRRTLSFSSFTFPLRFRQQITRIKRMLGFVLAVAGSWRVIKRRGEGKVKRNHGGPTGCFWGPLKSAAGMLFRRTLGPGHLRPGVTSPTDLREGPSFSTAGWGPSAGSGAGRHPAARRCQAPRTSHWLGSPRLAGARKAALRE